MQKHTKNIIIAAVLSAVLFIPFSCKKGPKEILDDFSLNIGTDIFEYQVQGVISDQASTQVPANAKVIIEGDDAEHIYDATTGKRTIAINSNGRFNLGIHPNHEPTAANPLRFSILVLANGYISQSQDVEVYEGQKRSEVKAGMISYSNPPSFLEIKSENMNLANGAIAQDHVFKGKTKADSVFYDDGLTTVVMTKGTRFWYWSNEVVGRGLRPTGRFNEIIDTVTINGETHTVTRKEAILDSADIMGYVKRTYTGSDLEIIAFYSKGRDLNYRVHERESHSETLIEILANDNVPVKNLLFESIVEKRLYRLEFRGTDGEGYPLALVPYSEPGEPRWFTSFVVDPSTQNPVTGTTIKEGDAVEVGYDLTTRKTLREIVKKASNGQFRIETQQVNAGFYSRALHTYSIDFDWDVSKPESVPDPENLYAYINVRLGDAYFGRSFRGAYNYIYPMHYTVSTRDAAVVTPYLDTYYCSQVLESRENISSGTVQVYDNATLLQKFPNLVSLDVSLICPKGQVVLKPSYYGSFTSNFNDIYMDIRDGLWATRGAKLGEVYRLYGELDGSSVDTSITINQGHNIIDYYLKANNGLCQ